MSENSRERPVVALVNHRFVRSDKTELTITDEIEEVGVLRFETDPSHVEVGWGFTLNLGNYESVRMDVRIAVPCYLEDVDNAYEWARAWVRERLDHEARAVRDRNSRKAEDEAKKNV